MSYRIQEIFCSLQGEGHRVGRRAVFVRFSGCNGWSGREEDRGQGPFACSQWCDTVFIGEDGSHGGRYEPAPLAAKCAELWGSDRARRYVVLTGGEPMLQVDTILIDTLRRFGFTIAIETNGTKSVPNNIDWITVSPKAGSTLIQTIGQELKLVYPQPGIDPAQFASLAFRHFFLQPRDGRDLAANTRAVLDYCLANPQWRISEQRHKMWMLP